MNEREGGMKRRKEGEKEKDKEGERGRDIWRLGEKWKWEKGFFPI